MLIYTYHPETGVYLGQAMADADPMELILAQEALFRKRAEQIDAALPFDIEDEDEGENNPARTDRRAQRDAALDAARIEASAVLPTCWLIPAHATETAPPETGPDEEAVMTAEGWRVRPIEAAPSEPEPEPAPPVTATAAARSRRDLAIVSVRGLIERHRDQSDLGIATTLTSLQFRALLTYVQALRDLPDRPGWPDAIVWPVAPDFVPASILQNAN